MKYTPQTKLSEIIKKEPWLAEELPKLDDRLKVINTPMGKLAARRMTVKDAADHLGVSVDLLLQKFDEAAAAYKKGGDIQVILREMMKG